MWISTIGERTLTKYNIYLVYINISTIVAPFNGIYVNIGLNDVFK